jgi:hypothetical protein
MVGICAGIRSHKPLSTIPWFSKMKDEDHCAGRCILVEGFATPAAYVEASCCDTSLATAAPYTSNVGEQMQPSSAQPSGWLGRETLSAAAEGNHFSSLPAKSVPAPYSEDLRALTLVYHPIKDQFLTGAYLLWCVKLRGDSWLKVCETPGSWD